jgi:hypothetical protein
VAEGFTCAVEDENYLSACKDLPKYSGSRYCVLHEPDEAKNKEEFEEAKKRKLARKDYDFGGTVFPDGISQKPSSAVRGHTSQKPSSAVGGHPSQEPSSAVGGQTSQKPSSAVSRHTSQDRLHRSPLQRFADRLHTSPVQR